MVDTSYISRAFMRARLMNDEGGPIEEEENNGKNYYNRTLCRCLKRNRRRPCKKLGREVVFGTGDYVADLTILIVIFGIEY